MGAYHNQYPVVTIPFKWGKIINCETYRLAHSKFLLNVPAINSNFDLEAEFLFFSLLCHSSFDTTTSLFFQEFYLNAVPGILYSKDYVVNYIPCYVLIICVRLWTDCVYRGRIQGSGNLSKFKRHAYKLIVDLFFKAFTPSLNHTYLPLKKYQHIVVPAVVQQVKDPAQPQLWWRAELRLRFVSLPRNWGLPYAAGVAKKKKSPSSSTILMRNFLFPCTLFPSGEKLIHVDFLFLFHVPQFFPLLLTVDLWKEPRTVFSLVLFSFLFTGISAWTEHVCCCACILAMSHKDLTLAQALLVDVWTGLPNSVRCCSCAISHIHLNCF